MATAGFFRLIPDLPVVFWKYPVSYMNYMAWALQVTHNLDCIDRDNIEEKSDILPRQLTTIYVHRVRTKTT